MKKALFLLLASVLVSNAAVAQDVKAGEKKVAMCIGCHGIPGYQSSFPEVHKVPMITGQTAQYIAASLNAYRKGDRKHPTMRAIAGSLTDQDIADIAAFYGQQAAKPGTQLPGEANPPSDKKVAELLSKGACVSCHGANFSKPVDPSYPKLAGQYADYLYVSMKAYKTANNALVGRNNAIMGAQVKPYSNAELKAIAEYLASLPGELKTEGQTAWHTVRR